ncbi:transmembrane protein 65-like [Paramacrobiotus metropolitanus]|uniref:transmembrane protein 65-like n=1 Tax=Paramacrobiotus metropolitanus TaxID=2943436 RepID=UPI0024456F2B|nr:transmembrane protein 65-like [Paramacrobiotus metropolitanus]
MPPRGFITQLARRTLFASEAVNRPDAFHPSLLSSAVRRCWRSDSHRSGLHTSSALFVPRWRTALITLRGEDHKVDAEEARNFVFLLEPPERELILKELMSFQEEPGDPLPPTPAQLRHLAMFCALPFIGFGFLDNLLMIIAGAYIEIGIGAVFTISTMAAAGLGNAVSDVAGIWSAGYIEHFVRKFGVTPPSLTPKQTGMGRTRWAMNVGRAVGITVGCILGMFPLLIYDFDTKDDKEDKSHKKEK